MVHLKKSSMLGSFQGYRTHAKSESSDELAGDSSTTDNSPPIQRTLNNWSVIVY